MMVAKWTTNICSVSQETVEATLRVTGTLDSKMGVVMAVRMTALAIKLTSATISWVSESMASRCGTSKILVRAFCRDPTKLALSPSSVSWK
jgi:hypothetical protein